MLAKVIVLEDQHIQTIISPRLSVISKVQIYKTKPAKQVLVALYAGFDNEISARRFMAWLQVNLNLTKFDVICRPGDRTDNPWEVKVRRPSQDLLDALVKKQSALKS